MTVTSRLHRQKDKERQRKTEEKVDRRPVVAPRYESGGEAQDDDVSSTWVDVAEAVGGGTKKRTVKLESINEGYKNNS